MANLLNADIINRKSFVFIITLPDNYEKNDSYFEVNKNWFQQAGILFGEYYVVDHRVSKEHAKSLIENASVVFLSGGDTFSQNNFLIEYDLKGAIKNCNGVIMGLSAGAMNMAEKVLSSPSVYDGVGMDDITISPHFTKDNREWIENVLFPQSKNMSIYALCDNSAIRVMNNTVQFLGEIYVVSNVSISRVESSS